MDWGNFEGATLDSAPIRHSTSAGGVSECAFHPASGRAASPEIGRMTIRQAPRPNFHCHLLNTGEKQVSSFMRFDLSGQMMHGPTRAPSAAVERSCCLIHASIAATKWQKADSARRCRFRKSQQKRASDLDSIDGWIPKLDVAGSNPVSRSIFSTTSSQSQTTSRKETE
jgi:hypothetical protein